MLSVPQAAPGLKVEARRAEIEQAIGRVLSSGRYILGAETEAFEREFADYVELPHVVGVNSGTDALTLALDAYGIGPGDEVLVPAMTAQATAMAVKRLKATPHIVDVEFTTRGMDPDLAEAAIGPQTRAIVVVHLHGIPAQIARIVAIARAHGLVVIEDCAQAHGARIDGKHVGNFGDAAAFSFYPTKNLGGIGDGGCVATRSDAAAARLRKTRNYGFDTRRVCIEDGFNSRLDDIQAAVLRVFLRTLDEDNAERRAFARRYDEMLRPLSEESMFSLPPGPEGCVYHQYAITCARRDDLRRALATAGIGTDIHYPLALHRQPAFARGADQDTLAPNADKLADSLLSLPIQPELSHHCEAVVDALGSALRETECDRVL
jgi:dTDP-3-amino-3,4,6-trideoxy-alpha-D-glucose transaminase